MCRCISFTVDSVAYLYFEFNMDEGNFNSSGESAVRCAREYCAICERVLCDMRALLNNLYGG